MVGEGCHRRAGGPHAEIVAMQRAGVRTKEATLYVTLEPCCTWGRTPPCTDAVIASGVRRVVVGARDPNARHAGRGLRRLRRAGIEVIEGVCREEALALIAPFSRWITRKRPLVTLKLGTTVDGRIADCSGKSRWITSSAARVRIQALRRRVDAIMVGAGTVRADNPELQPRPSRGRRPLRVVVSGRGQVPVNARLFTDEHRTRTILAVPAGARGRSLAALERAGVNVWRVPGSRQQVSLARLLDMLAGEGCMHLLCEGGGGLAGRLIREELVDEFLFIVAPLVMGAGIPAVAGEGWPLKNAPRLRFISVERVGPDVMIRAVPERGGR